MSLPLHPAQSVENLKSDLGGSPEQSYIDVSSVSSGAFETFTATFAAYASTAQGDYLAFTEPGGTKFAVWLDKAANGTPPSGAVYTAADQKIEVDASSGTATQVATAFKDALEADNDFVQYDIVQNGAILTFTANALGTATDAAPHNTGDTGAGSIVVAVTQQGAAAGSQNKYVVLRDDDTGLFHAWLNFNSEGVDPDPGGGSVAIEAAVAGGASASAVATAMAAAIEAHAEFTSSADGSVVKVVTATNAPATDLGAGDSGFTVSVSTQGAASKYYASLNPGSISNNPSTF